MNRMSGTGGGSGIEENYNRSTQTNSSDEDEQHAKDMQLFSIIRKKYTEDQIIQEIRKCLENGAEINALNSRGKTILDIAQRKNYKKLVKFLTDKCTKVAVDFAGRGNNYDSHIQQHNEINTNLQRQMKQLSLGFVDQFNEELDALLLVDNKKTLDIEKIAVLNKKLQSGLDNQAVIKSFMRCEIDINKQDSKTHLLAIDNAWEYEYYESVLMLLEAGSKFPKDITLGAFYEESVPDKLKKFVSERQELHRWIQNNEKENIEQFIINHQLTNFFNIDNRSALEVAAEYANVEILAALSALQLPLKEILLSEDHWTLVHYVNAEGNTLLSIAAKNGKVDNVLFFISCGIHVNHQNESEKRAVDLAWDNMHYDVVFILLKADSNFPNDFNLDGSNEENSWKVLKQFVDGRNLLHKLIQNKASCLKDIKDYISVEKSKFYLNSNSETAIFTAIKNKRLQLYAFFKSKGLTFKNEEEEKWINKLTLAEKDTLQEEMIRVFPQVDKGHILYFMSKSRSHKPVDNFKERIEKLYEDLDDVPEVSLILQVLQYTDYLDIVFDFDNENIKDINPTASEATRGTTDYKYGRIYIAAKIEYRQLLGTLAHELTHLAMYVLYKNDCNPYYSIDNAQSQSFKTIVDIIKENTKEVVIGTNDAPVITLAMAFQRPKDEWNSELIVRVPHILAQYPVTGREFITQEKFNLLFEYFNNKEERGLSYRCKEFIGNSFLIKPKNSIQFLNEYLGKLNDLIKQDLTFEDSIEVDGFLKSRNQILLVNTESTLLSILRIYENMIIKRNYSLQDSLFLDFSSYEEKEHEILNLFYSPAGRVLCISCSCDSSKENILGVTIKLKEILDRKLDKKLIIIIQEGQIELFTKITSAFNHNIEQIKHSFTLNSFTKESQEKLLEREILFQKENTFLRKFIDISDDIAKKNIKTTTLVKLIKRERIEIGHRPPGTPDLEGAYSELLKEVDMTSFISQLLSQESRDIYIISGISGSDKQASFLSCLKYQMEVIGRNSKHHNLKNCFEALNQRLGMTNISKKVQVADDHFQEKDFKKLCHKNPTMKIYWVRLIHEVNNFKFILQLIYNPDFYLVSKRFNNEIVINKQILEVLGNETLSETFIICVKHNIEIIRWLQFKEDAQEIQFHNNCQMKKIQFVHSQDEMEYNFRKCVESSAGDTVHLLIFQENQLIWCKTYGTFNILSKYRARYHKNIHSLIEEDNIIKEVQDKKVIIIAGDPGIGKSTTLVQLYTAIFKLPSQQKELIKSHWVISVKLKDHLESINKMKLNSDLDEIADFLIHVENKTSDDLTESFAKDLIYIRLWKKNCKKPLFIAFDGFDEVLDKENRNKIIALLQHLKDKTYAKFCITTRLHYEKDLEGALSTFAIKLEPMNDLTIRKYIINYFSNRLSLLLSPDKFSEIFDSNDEGILKFSNAIFNKMQEIFRDNMSEFIGTPLQLYLILEGSEKCFEKWIKNANATSVNLSYLGNDIWEVYEKFVCKKYDIVCKKIGLKEEKQKHENKEKLDKYHMDLAKALKNVTSSVKDSFNEFQDIVLLAGIVRSDGNRVDFIHPTFAEYFSAKACLFWIKKWKEPCHSKLTNLQKQQYFFNEILNKPNFRVVRTFLNAKFSKKKVENFQLNKDYYDKDILFVAAKENLAGIAEFLYHNFSNIDVNVQNIYHNTVLHQAARFENLEFVLWLLDKGAHVDAVDNKGRTVLHKASELGYFEIIKCLIENGANVNARDQRHCTVLLNAVILGNLDIVKWLVNKHANVDTVDIYGSTVLHVAASLGYLEIFKYLLNKGVKVNATDNHGRTVLHRAVESGHLEIVKYLVKNTANIESVDQYGLTVLHRAVAIAPLETVKWLVEQGAKVDAKDNESLTVLHHAIICRRVQQVKWLVDNSISYISVADQKICLCDATLGCFDIVKNLLEKNSNVNWVCRSDAKCKDCKLQGQTVLHLTSESEYLDKVKFLVEKGAKFDVADKDGNTVLHHAARLGSLETVKLLLENGAQLNVANNNGQTVSLLAASSGHLEVVKLLVKKFAFMTNGMLHAAAAAGHVNIVKWLVNNGANIDAVFNQMTVLCRAVVHGHLAIVIWLIENGAKVNAVDNLGRSVLHIAAASGYLEIVKFLVINGAILNVVDHLGRTVLSVATGLGNVEVVKWLLENGADIDADVDKVLHPAAANGNLELFMWLLDKGLKTDAANDDGWSVLHTAIKYGNLEIVKRLVESGAKVDDVYNLGVTVLHLAAAFGHLHIVKWLVEHGANLMSVENEGKTALHIAAESGHLDIVDYLVNKGAKMEAVDNDGDTVIHTAAAQGYLELVKWLIQEGADVNTRNYKGWTVLTHAARSGNLELVKWLAENGANINDVDNEGYLLTHVAIATGHLEIVKWLVTKGVNVNAVGCNGWTVLHQATRSCNLESVKWLVENGANIHDVDNKGCSVIHTAAAGGNLEIITWLVEEGVNVDNKDNNGITALHAAAAYGRLDVIKWLVEKGVKVDNIDNYGHTALHVAATSGHLEIFKWLQENGAKIDVKIKTP